MNISGHQRYSGKCDGTAQAEYFEGYTTHCFMYTAMSTVTASKNTVAKSCTNANATSSLDF
jgi:hypothetical protein